MKPWKKEMSLERVGVYFVIRERRHLIFQEKGINKRKVFFFFLVREKRKVFGNLLMQYFLEY